MKHNVVNSVVLALCALQLTAAQFKPSFFIDEINSKINNAIKGVEAEVAGTKHRIDYMFGNVLPNIQTAITGAQEKVINKIVDVIPHLKDSAKDSGPVQACVNHTKENFAKSLDEAKELVKAYVALQRAKFPPYFARVNATIQKFREISTSTVSSVMQCFSNIFNVVSCVTPILPNLVIQIGELIFQSFEDAASNSQILLSVASDVKQLGYNITKNVEKRYGTLVNETIQCVQVALKS